MTNWMPRPSFTLVFLLTPALASAQIIQSVSKGAVPGVKQTDAAAAAVSSGATGTDLFPQGNLDAATDGGLKVGIEAADLYFNRNWRLYMRLTLPVSDKSGSTSAAATGPSALALTNTMIQQFTDPYGGVLNLSGGFFYRFGGAATESSSEFGQRLNRALKGAGAAALAVSAVTGQLTNPHGLFLDVRGGLKAATLPNLVANAPTISGTPLAVYGTAIAGLKAILPAYDADPTTGSDQDHYVGGVTLGIYGVANFALDPSQSSAIGTTVTRNVYAVTGMFGWNPKDSSKVALTFAFTPWISDRGLAKQWVFGVTVQQPPSKS